MSDILIDNKVISINKMNHSMVYDVFQNSQDENNKKYVPDEVFDTLEEASEVVDFIIKSYDSKDGPFIYAVIRKEDNANMGYVQLVKIEEGWEIGYHIASPYTGKGYATMAANLFIDYLKNNTDVKELYGIALAANKASRRVLEKCGFRLIFEGSGIYQGKRRKIIRTIRHLSMKDKLETERLLLRHFREDDAEAMFNNWASDPEVTKYMTWNPHENVETTKYILGLWMEEYKKPETIRFGITLKSSGELIGGIDVVEHIDNKPVIGYCLSRKYWNKGYMTEACTAMINYLFSLGNKEILISAVDENIGSNRVIQKCGFTFVNQEEAPMSSFKPEIVKINNYKINK